MHLNKILSIIPNVLVFNGNTCAEAGFGLILFVCLSFAYRIVSVRLTGRGCGGMVEIYELQKAAYQLYKYV